MKTYSKTEETGLFRWELARNKQQYQNDYRKLVIKNVFPINNETVKYFLNKYKILPLDPNFSFQRLINRIRQLKREEIRKNKAIDFICQKYIGKNYKKKNGILIKWMIFLETPQGKKWKNNKILLDKLKEIRLGNQKASVEIKQRGLNIEPLELGYLERVLLHLCSLKLSQTETTLLTNKASMIKSYLTQDPRIDGTLIDDIDEFNGDISKVTLEINITFPTRTLEKSLREEVSRWKKFYHRFSKPKRFNFDKRELDEMCDVLKLSKEYTKTEIAQKVYKSKDQYAIQKTTRRLEKAKEYIEAGGYIHIK